MKSCDLLIRNTSEVVTLRGSVPRLGSELDRAHTIPRGAVAIADGRIVEVGPEQDLAGRYDPRESLDAERGTLLPGFVDAHTHPVFGATREAEFDLRLHGRSYQEITAAGGGIFSSVRSLRQTPDGELAELVRQRLDRFIAAGTTTIEAKSGYGLNRKDELRSLELLCSLGAEHPLEIKTTFLGAHQMPLEYADRRDEYISFLIGEMLPEVRRRGLAGACDIFCDEGAYTLGESRRLLEAAREQGFSLRVHADELKGLGAAELAASLGACSADHLCRISDAGIDALREAGTSAVLLPGTVLSLGAKALPPARKLIDRGVTVVIATDFNPGTSYVIPMPIVIAIACTLFRMTVAEALSAATINAAHSLGIAERVGSIEPGKQADLVLLDRPSYLFMAYELGDNSVCAVLKQGRLVYRRPALKLLKMEPS